MGEASEHSAFGTGGDEGLLPSGERNPYIPRDRGVTCGEITVEASSFRRFPEPCRAPRKPADGDPTAHFVRPIEIRRVDLVSGGVTVSQVFGFS